MQGIRYDIGGKTLIFSPTGEVGQSVNGVDTAVGKWKSESAEKDNQIRYDIQGQAQPPIPCRYGFNPSNQLTAALKKADATFTPDFAFNGFIEVDDGMDIVYNLLAADGKLAGVSITVYGAISFDADNFLRITYADKTFARAKGDGGAAAIEAIANLSDPKPEAGDLLRFNATTINTLAAGRKARRALIQVKGSWEPVGDESLAFVANHSGGKTQIGFAGKFKGVAAGFAYTSDPTGTKIGFVVSGKHQWNSVAAQWDVAIGFTNRTVQAHLSGAVTKTLPNGSVSVDGTFDLVGQKIKFDVHLQVRHTFNAANQLIFTADVSTDPSGHLNYDLKLEGTFQFNGLVLTFAAEVMRDKAKLSFTLATSANQQALMVQLTATLSRTPTATELTIGFTLVMNFQNGKLVKGEPKQLPAAPPAAAGAPGPPPAAH
jgi:hypothetical protein